MAIAKSKSGAARPASSVTPKAVQAKAPARPVRKPAAARTAKKVPTAKLAKAEKAVASVKDKPVKDKLVRDSFTIPKSEYQVLDTLKQRAGKLGRPVKRSELLRAGVKALAAMGDAAFTDSLNAVPTIKTGRPRKD